MDIRVDVKHRAQLIPFVVEIELNEQDLERLAFSHPLETMIRRFLQPLRPYTGGGMLARWAEQGPLPIRLDQLIGHQCPTRLEGVLRTLEALEDMPWNTDGIQHIAQRTVLPEWAVAVCMGRTNS